MISEFKLNNLIIELERLIENSNQYSIDQEINSLIKPLFPTLTKEELQIMFRLFSELYQRNSGESVEIVGTLPTIASLKTRRTLPVIIELIESARENILITGYSISQFTKELFQKLIDKSKRGVLVEIFIDDKVEILNQLRETFIYKGHFLRIYQYRSQQTKSSLHAKTIVVDNKKALISSSNLSYGGMIQNIELGVLIEGKKALHLYEIFNGLLAEGLFRDL